MSTTHDTVSMSAPFARMTSLSFAALRIANERRQAEWPGNEQIDKAFRTLETAGEGGELAEAIEVHLRTSLLALATIGSLGRISEQMKKFLRAERGIKGSTACLGDIAREMGDCIIALDLLANELGIDLGDTVASKFNETSQKYGLRTVITNKSCSIQDMDTAIGIAEAICGPGKRSRTIHWFGIKEAIQRERIMEAAERLSSSFQTGEEAPSEGSE